jgi:putative oxidoreductase
MATPTETRSVETSALDELTETLGEHAHWVLRAAFAAVFVFHGVDKLAAPGGFAEMMGLPLAVAVLVALAETAAGALVLVGGFGVDWATRLAGLLAIPVMLGAIAMVHWPRWTFVPAPEQGFPMGGMEFQVTLIAIGLCLGAKGNEI